MDFGNLKPDTSTRNLSLGLLMQMFQLTRSTVAEQSGFFCSTFSETEWTPTIHDFYIYILHFILHLQSEWTPPHMNFTFTLNTWCCTSPFHTAPNSCLSSWRQLVNFHDWLPPSMWVMHISGWWLWPQIQTNPNEKYTKANVYDCLPPSMRVMHKSGAVAVLCRPQFLPKPHKTSQRRRLFPISAFNP